MDDEEKGEAAVGREKEGSGKKWLRVVWGLQQLLRSSAGREINGGLLQKGWQARLLGDGSSRAITVGSGDMRWAVGELATRLGSGKGW
ncbi:hypothetical protein B296_00005845 [Ensete ventricosum]|uniref:Uncharacterized protein n=1 Tax=Ensete ventricosum TaxID=4639 RepID=A0A426ZPV3_ENSVE|nr:hypothetical protein B296_00005845 [Ensete ventricosum]